jgi:hypothetical protein
LDPELEEELSDIPPLPFPADDVPEEETCELLRPTAGSDAVWGVAAADGISATCLEPFANGVCHCNRLPFGEYSCEYFDCHFGGHASTVVVEFLVRGE